MAVQIALSSTSFSSATVIASLPRTSLPCLTFPPPFSIEGASMEKLEPVFRRGARHSIISIVAVPDISSTEATKKLAAKESQPPVYPFSAIVGQDEMKLCLLLNVIDPNIGGVMIMGDRGTGKSATVRSLVDLLPEIRVVVGDPFNSDPEDPESMGMEVRECVMKVFFDHIGVLWIKAFAASSKISDRGGRGR